MKGSGGSCLHAAALAAKAALELGLSRLKVLIVKEIAAFGGNAYETDGKICARLRRPDGRQYHRESFGRARRELARAGVIVSERVMPFHKPRNATFATSHGTTNKDIRWQALGIKNPLSRGELRRMRHERQAQERQKPPPDHPRGPRYSAAVHTAILDAKELRERAAAAAEVIGPAFTKLDALMERRFDAEERGASPSSPSERGPPD